MQNIKNMIDKNNYCNEKRITSLCILPANTRLNRYDTLFVVSNKE